MIAIWRPLRHQTPAVVRASYQPTAKSATALRRTELNAPTMTSPATKKNGKSGIRWPRVVAPPTIPALVRGADSSTGARLSSKAIMNSSIAVGLAQMPFSIVSSSGPV